MNIAVPQIELPVLFAQTASAFRVSADKLFAPLNLNSGQVLMLTILWNRDGRTQSGLARDLGVSAPTVNKMVRTLTDRGFVSSSRCALDGRSVRIFLTDNGRLVEGPVSDCWSQAGAMFFGGFTDIEKLIMLQMLRRSRQNVSSAGAPVE